MEYYQQKYVEFESETFLCGNCNSLFYIGTDYPKDTFCCSHCYNHYHGDECKEKCQDCLDDQVD